MNRHEEQPVEDLIDLGLVTEQTKGPAGVPFDTLGGLRIPTGLTDD